MRPGAHGTASGTSGRNRRCDVLVVGAGPAGSMAALSAAEAGADVVMIDRRARIGSPARCAGLISMPLLHNLGRRCGIGHAVIAQAVTRMQTHYPAGIEESRSFGYIVHRDRFDQVLTAAAVDAGCELMTAHRAVAFDGDAVRVRNAGAELDVTAGVIIGADGPLSLVGRSIGVTNREFARAAQWLMPLKRPTTTVHINFDRDSIPGGYGWLFPRGEHALVGVALSGVSSRVTPILRSFAARMVEEGTVGANPVAATGGLIPVGGPLRCRGGNVLLAGDAAGHCNPLTGAGVGTAMLSGELAGQSAADHVFGGGVEALQSYEDEIEFSFASSLRRAARQRRDLMAAWQDDKDVFVSELRRAWFAFPECGAALS